MDALVSVLAIGAFVLVLVLFFVVRRHHKLLRGLPELREELEKIAKELKAENIISQIDDLKNEVKDNARRFNALRVIIARIYEAEEGFAKYAKKLAQRERPEEVIKPLVPEVPEEQKEKTQEVKTKGDEKNE